MERKEISEQIGELNLKIFSANKELEEMELNIRRKKIEIRRYKNEVTGLQLMLEEIDIEIVNLFYYSSMSIKDIARKLNISELNVKTRLHRIRKKIKKELNNGGI